MGGELDPRGSPQRQARLPTRPKRLEDERGRDRAAAALGDALVGVGAVAEPASGDQRGGAASVEVDRAVREVDEDGGEFLEREARVGAGAAVAGDREELAVRERERGARVAGGGDVGVELRGPGGEPLAVVVAVVDGGAVADEQRAGLEEVALGMGGERVAGGDARGIPLVRSSPSGSPAGRVKKPPTSASRTPWERHQDDSVCPRTSATRTPVVAASWRATCTVVRRPSASRTRGRRRCGSRSGQTSARALAIYTSVR